MRTRVPRAPALPNSSAANRLTRRNTSETGHGRSGLRHAAGPLLERGLVQSGGGSEPPPYRPGGRRPPRRGGARRGGAGPPPPPRGGAPPPPGGPVSCRDGGGPTATRAYTTLAPDSDATTGSTSSLRTSGTSSANADTRNP